MRWFTKHLRNVGMASVSILFLLTCLALIPLSAASAHEGTSEVATLTTVTVQATPTEDATVTALSKEKLEQEVLQLKEQNTPDLLGWLRANASFLFSTLIIVGGGLFGLWRWRVDRRDAQDKEWKDRQIAQDKELEDRKVEREKRAEERFQAAVMGLGDEKESVKAGAAILLRTFLRPGYEQFYAQVLNLTVVHLRLLRTTHSSDDLDASLSLTTLSQALVVAFKESFPLARDEVKKEIPLFDSPPPDMVGIHEIISSQYLDVSHTQLDNAYLDYADLNYAWMQHASMRKAHLSAANLRKANLGGADLSGANLAGANLSGADLSGANLAGANLFAANLSEADLHDTNFSEANLRSANLHKTSLWGTNLSKADLGGANLNDVVILPFKPLDLRGVKGLTKNQLADWAAQSNAFDELFTSSTSQPTVASSSPPQSNNAQPSPTAPTQVSTPPADPDGSNTASSQQEPEA